MNVPLFIMPFWKTIMKNRRFASIAVLALALCSSTVRVQGQTAIWTNVISGNWSQAVNWFNHHVPAFGDTVYITNGVPMVTLDVTAQIAGLVVGTNGNCGTQTNYGYYADGQPFTGTVLTLFGNTL